MGNAEVNAKHPGPDRPASRRRFLGAVGAAAGGVALSGCTNVLATSDSDPDTVEYWTLFGGGDGDVMAQMTDRAVAEHDITVNRQRSATDYYTRLYTSLVGNQAPDVAIVHATRLREYEDLVEPIGNEIPLDPYLDTIAERVVRNGDQLATPLDAHPYGLYYNKEIFEEAGLNPNEPPNTPQKFRQAAEAIKKETDHWPMHYNGADIVINTLVVLMNSLGGVLLTDEGEPRINNRNGLAVARTLNEWVHERGWCPVDDSTGWDAWNRGEVGMIFEGTWHVSVVQEAGFDFGLTQPFVMPNSKTPKTFADSHTLVIPKSDTRSASVRADAVTLIKALTQEYNAYWAREAGHVPAYEAAGSNDDLRSSRMWNQTLEVFYGMAENDHLAYPPATDNNQDYIEQLSRYFQGLRLGSLTPKQTIRQSAEGLQQVYL
ncbi:extracellular solute-binding protein [Halococcus sp. IIIV-5B]|uniref:extracellular solute-binding protein n=1 Tax=Halococcus sp. IIIV-5B TaxID=2321230 RepID=UPI000E738ED7|nr:extracellular solute-binding protein [Halococcus sp. IIIV-5B]RJT06898.1 extracellular solute-binding protein [Halococcus sp. IIIV-5B]